MYNFLIPAYKKQFFKKSVLSILSLAPPLSIVVSDDCSPEDLRSIVEEFSDERIIYQRTESNIGGSNLVDHWNLLLSQCDSEYLIMASDDDVYAPGFLEEVDRLVNKYPDVDLIHVRSNTIDADGNVLKEDLPMPEFLTYEEFLNHFLSQDSILCIGNFVFKTEALKRVGGFVKFPLAWKSDTATQIALAHNGVANSSNVLFSFRMSGTNISSQLGHDDAKNWMKLDAIVEFDKWLGTELNEALPAERSKAFRQAFRKRLEGESRTYYLSLPLQRFRSLYHKFVIEGWFCTLRNRLSFVVNWIIQKMKCCLS